jgi:radical SAM superfamily enzyme YgiQ (UPF0313 family)
MNILLISANSLTEPYPVYPIGLDYVEGVIDPRHKVLTIDINCQNQKENLEQIIQAFRPDLIGISIRNIDNTDKINVRGFIAEHKELVKTLKAITQCKIVLGGSGFTLFPDELLTYLGADYGVAGEGERINSLINAIEKQECLDNLPGIIYPGLKKEFPLPWNQLPKRKIENKQYTDIYLKNGGMLNLQTKRGCNCNCIYCTYPIIEGRTLRLVPPDVVAQEAFQLQQLGAKYIFMSDALFNADTEHNLAIADAFLCRGINIPWGGYFAPLKPPKNYYQQLAKAGLRHVEFGTEALSNNQLKWYRKPFNVSHVFEAHEQANDAGIHVAHYFILNGPEETRETLDETLTNACKLNKSVLFFFCGMRIYPNTALYDLSVKEKVIDLTESLLSPVFYQSSAISEEQVMALLYERGEFRPNWIMGIRHKKNAKGIKLMYQKGFSGPTWEWLIR